MGLFDLFTKSISNIINDEINGITAKLEKKIDNAITGLFSKALKKLGIGGKLNRQLQSRFAEAVFSRRADRYLGKASSAADRLSPKDICNNMLPKAGETAFGANENLKQNRAANRTEFYAYPNQDMKYYMKMSFKSYVRTTPQSRPKPEAKHTIVLPLPKELSEGFSVRLSDAEAGMAGAGANLLQEAGGQMGNNSMNLLYQMVAKKLGEATSGQFNQFAGAIPNPFMTVMFQGINLRTFSFSWTFSPRTADESQRLQQIITLLKLSALPQYSPNTNFGFLQYPLMVQIDLYPWAAGAGSVENHKKRVLSFKPAMIENLSINYSPNGIPSFFAGTSLPTFYQITMDIKELEIFTSNDYGRYGDTDKVSELQPLVFGAAQKILGPVGFNAVVDTVNDLGEAFGQYRDDSLKVPVPTIDTSDATGEE